MNDLVERQQAAIDEIGATIHQRSTGSADDRRPEHRLDRAGPLLGWLISRSLLKQLGGEPATPPASPTASPAAT
jgi:methyl-accepting chemotaxis protein